MIEWVNEDIGFFVGPVSIGVVKTDGEFFLIDTGIDNSAVNKVVKELTNVPSGAFITHHHADHMGGISKLNSLGVKEIYVPENEYPFFMHPFLEPFYFCGFFPPKSLKNRHLMARPATYAKPLKGDPISHIVPIPSKGHSLDHMSYFYNGVLFSGDLVFKSEIIEKHGILFTSNPQQTIDSIKSVKRHKFDAVILGHGGLIDSRSDALNVFDTNIEHYRNVQNTILSSIPESGIPFDNVVTKTLGNLSLKKANMTQFILYRHTILGYVSNFLEDGLIVYDNGDLKLA